MRKKEITIKHIVDDKSTGFYIETDLIRKTVVVGKGIKRIQLSLWEASRLGFLLKRQIDRLTGNYPKETDRDKNKASESVAAEYAQMLSDKIKCQTADLSWQEKSVLETAKGLNPEMELTVNSCNARKTLESLFVTYAIFLNKRIERVLNEGFLSDIDVAAIESGLRAATSMAVSLSRMEKREPF